MRTRERREKGKHSKDGVLGHHRNCPTPHGSTGMTGANRSGSGRDDRARHHFLDRVPLPSRSSLQQRGRRPSLLLQFSGFHPPNISLTLSCHRLHPYFRWARLSQSCSARLGCPLRTRTTHALQDLRGRRDDRGRPFADGDGRRRWRQRRRDATFSLFSPHSGSTLDSSGLKPSFSQP